MYAQEENVEFLADDATPDSASCHMPTFFPIDSACGNGNESENSLKDDHLLLKKKTFVTEVFSDDKTQDFNAEHNASSSYPSFKLQNSMDKDEESPGTAFTLYKVSGEESAKFVGKEGGQQDLEVFDANALKKTVNTPPGSKLVDLWKDPMVVRECEAHPLQKLRSAKPGDVDSLYDEFSALKFSSEFRNNLDEFCSLDGLAHMNLLELRSMSARLESSLLAVTTEYEASRNQETVLASEIKGLQMKLNSLSEVSQSPVSIASLSDSFSSSYFPKAYCHQYPLQSSDMISPPNSRFTSSHQQHTQLDRFSQIGAVAYGTLEEVLGGLNKSFQVIYNEVKNLRNVEPAKPKKSTVLDKRCKETFCSNVGDKEPPATYHPYEPFALRKISDLGDFGKRNMQKTWSYRNEAYRDGDFYVQSKSLNDVRSTNRGCSDGWNNEFSRLPPPDNPPMPSNSRQIPPVFQDSKKFDASILTVDSQKSSLNLAGNAPSEDFFDGEKTFEISKKLGVGCRRSSLVPETTKSMVQKLPSAENTLKLDNEIPVDTFGYYANLMRYRGVAEEKSTNKIQDADLTSAALFHDANDSINLESSKFLRQNVSAVKLPACSVPGRDKISQQPQRGNSEKKFDLAYQNTLGHAQIASKLPVNSEEKLGGTQVKNINIASNSDRNQLEVPINENNPESGIVHSKSATEAVDEIEDELLCASQSLSTGFDFSNNEDDSDIILAKIFIDKQVIELRVSATELVDSVAEQWVRNNWSSIQQSSIIRAKLVEFEPLKSESKAQINEMYPHETLSFYKEELIQFASYKLTVYLNKIEAEAESLPVCCEFVWENIVAK